MSCFLAQNNLHLSFTVVAPSGKNLCFMPLPAHQSVNYWRTSGSRFKEKIVFQPSAKVSYAVRKKENFYLDKVRNAQLSVAQSTFVIKVRVR